MAFRSSQAAHVHACIKFLSIKEKKNTGEDRCKIKGKQDTYMNIEKITNMAHFVSYERMIRDISPFTINNELVMVYT